jgi:peptidoglycan-N-acetylglucosamine deacetylase
MLYSWAVRYFRPWLSSVVLYSVPATPSKKVAFTFDDVPYKGTKNINAIADYLHANGCGATFFCLGDRLEKMVDKIHLHEGIEVANHGYTNHSALWAGATAIGQEMAKTHDIMQWKCGSDKVAPFYRPGSGLYNSSIVQAAKSRDLQVVLGDVYPFDPHIPLACVVASSVCYNIQPGSVVIMHDRTWTMRALKVIVPKLLALGYRIVSVSELLSKSSDAAKTDTGSSSSVVSAKIL